MGGAEVRRVIDEAAFLPGPDQPGVGQLLQVKRQRRGGEFEPLGSERTQKVDVRVDVYPDVTFAGRVDGIDSGTGAAFSLLPPQNASGNWVKVVQRVPVKIVLANADGDRHPLRLGLSAEVSVNAADRSGALLRARRSP